MHKRRNRWLFASIPAAITVIVLAFFMTRIVHYTPDHEIQTLRDGFRATLGDAVYELVVRTILVREMTGRTKDMNRKAIKAVSAKAQSEMMNTIEPLLSEEEEAVYRRGRNANSPTMAKNATVAEYRRATGFEALIGYLYLKGDTERITELVRAAFPDR